MSYQLEYIKETYDLPFLKKGLPVEINGKKGVITSAKNAYIMVKFHDENSAQACHPTWKVKYFDNNMNPLKDFTEKQ